MQLLVIIHNLFGTVILTRSSAVAVVANRTAYSYRPLAGIAAVSMSRPYFLISSFKLKSAFDDRSLLLMIVSFLAVCCALWLNDTSYGKSV